MKSIKRTITLLLTGLLCFSFVACKDGTTPSVNSGDSTGNGNTNNRVEAEVTEEEISAKTKNVKISIPDTMTEDSYSVVDLQYFFNKAMNFEPEIVPDTTAVQDGVFYLAIGADNQMLLDNARRTGYTVLTSKDLGHSGIALQTFDNITCMYGTTEAGNCNAVYEFLKHTFNYEYFAVDCFNIDQSVSVKWRDFSVRYEPLIDMPCLLIGPLLEDDEWMRRSRARNYYQTWIGGMFAHSHFSLIPKDKYQASHPEWYSPTGVHLCLSGGGVSRDELVQTMADNICNKIATDTTGRNYLAVGQEDSFTICSCQACQDYVAQYETETLGASVQNVEFTNDVITKVNAWMAENCPERDITFVMFAYNATKYPPVRFNEKTNEYEPVVKTVENLNVQFVINFVDYAKPYTDHENYVAMMEGWRAVTNELSVWQYSANFTNYLEPFENWGSLAANYKWLAENGVSYIVEQGSHNTVVSYFEEMRVYVMANLCWGETDDTEYLVNKFLKAYYGEGAEDMRALYDLTRSNIAVIQHKTGAIISSGDYQIMSQTNWSLALLNRLESKIDSAIEKMQVYKDVNPDYYDMMVARFEKSRIWITYYQLNFYPEAYADYAARRAALKEAFEKLGIKISESDAGYGGTQD